MELELSSNDGRTFALHMDAAKLSVFVTNMIEDATLDGPIPLSTIDGDTLEKIVEYCVYHQEEKDPAEVQRWDQAYLNMNDKLLFNVIMAANFLEIKALLDIGCRRIAEEIRGKTSEEIRLRFNIDEPFNVEDEEEMHRQHTWTN